MLGNIFIANMSSYFVRVLPQSSGKIEVDPALKKKVEKSDGLACKGVLESISDRKSFDPDLKGVFPDDCGMSYFFISFKYLFM